MNGGIARPLPFPPKLIDARRQVLRSTVGESWRVMLGRLESPRQHAAALPDAEAGRHT